MARKPNVLNVPIKITLHAPGDLQGYWWATATVRFTPIGSIAVTCYGTCPASARRFAQAAVLDRVASTLRGLAYRADRAGATILRPSTHSL